MRLTLLDRAGPAHAQQLAGLEAALRALGIDAQRRDAPSGDAPTVRVVACADAPPDDPTTLALTAAPHEPRELIERAVCAAWAASGLRFDDLSLFTEGDSKRIHRWTDQLIIARFKPTVYSYTANRYGHVPGTEAVRARFTAMIFRRMAALPPSPHRPKSCFVAALPTDDASGPLIVERQVATCNLEVRVKRYHIGSPVHRYLYTDAHPSALPDAQPITRWTRLPRPVVCFDWRHPLTAHEDDRRLADEPLPDDYAALWMHDTPHAKEMARQTFSWLEALFAEAGVLLIDMCLFISADGQTIYGEVSPDCMRVRLGLGDPAEAEAQAKDLWRDGRQPHELLARYEALLARLSQS